MPWDPEHFLSVMNARKERDEVCFGPAYNISNFGSTTPKPEKLVQQVFAPLWGPLTRKRLRPRDNDSLPSFYGRLREANGLGSFMAAQVVADVKYVQLKHARDLPSPLQVRAHGAGLIVSLIARWMSVGGTTTRGGRRFAGRTKKSSQS